MLFTFNNHCSNISLKKSKEKNKKSHSPPAVHLQKNSKEIKNKEKNSPPKWLKKLKKEMLVTFRKKNHLLSKCQDLELEFSKKSWSSVKKKIQG